MENSDGNDFRVVDATDATDATIDDETTKSRRPSSSSAMDSKGGGGGGGRNDENDGVVIELLDSDDDDGNANEICHAVGKGENVDDHRPPANGSETEDDENDEDDDDDDDPTLTVANDVWNAILPSHTSPAVESALLSSSSPPPTHVIYSPSLFLALSAFDLPSVPLHMHH